MACCGARQPSPSPSAPSKAVSSPGTRKKLDQESQAREELIWLNRNKTGFLELEESRLKFFKAWARKWCVVKPDALCLFESKEVADNPKSVPLVAVPLRDIVELSKVGEMEFNLVSRPATGDTAGVQVLKFKGTTESVADAWRVLIDNHRSKNTPRNSRV
eukprot:GILJ01005304.1.p1 GENE.GILJ01005304.1~~GILJ01005304.1.p1  ORF type:complete len:173 (-),score=14.59 GILJ01005304.1:161-640(-)